jgi:hypothetical protein
MTCGQVGMRRVRIATLATLSQAIVPYVISAHRQAAAKIFAPDDPFSNPVPSVPSMKAHGRAHQPTAPSAHNRGTQMKSRLTVGLLTTLAAITAQGAHSADQMETVTITAHRPHTVAAQNATQVLSDAEQALNEYFTRDASTARVSNLWIYPTNDSNSVFVQYELRNTGGDGSHLQLALIELRGQQITRIVDLAGVPATRVASTSAGG